MSDDKRSAPRYARQHPVYLNYAELLTTNVSLTGMQLECPELRIHRIRPQLDMGTVELEIHLDRDQLKATCDVSYVSPYGDEFLIGVEFERFEGKGKEVWASYIGTLTNPLRG
jgi:hypothetical protein